MNFNERLECLRYVLMIAGYDENMLLKETEFYKFLYEVISFASLG